MIHKVEPIYPDTARQARIEGTVILETIIDENGTVSDVRILRGVNSMLDDAAVQAVSQWKYTPAMLENKPVRVYLTVTVNFS